MRRSFQQLRFRAAAVLLAALFCGPNPAAAEDWPCLAPKPGHPTAEEKEAFFRALQPLAQEAERRHGPPAAVLLAIAMNESRYGWTRFALEANNFFGMKFLDSDAAGGREAWTLECESGSGAGTRYIRFADPADAISYAATLFAGSERYAEVTQRYRTTVAEGGDVKKAVRAFVEGIARAGYATDERYPVTILRYINNYQDPDDSRSESFSLYTVSPNLPPTLAAQMPALPTR